ncbi:hypothetical protein GGS23DRAFT_134791 [Durotheca rogersii]|uniref:uncharacterized protein n=1 Tax=Durotheca rogersii TaxID=419775 RepID=UPI002220085B|nr:uncharacterized protein GGS23DRAFT_134791 [Durotheca rogersii]KAI5861845.1 hypothetical protein GGS23DRAFT_134791 [Durotheca rogersii]
MPLAQRRATGLRGVAEETLSLIHAQAITRAVVPRDANLPPVVCIGEVTWYGSTLYYRPSHRYGSDQARCVVVGRHDTRPTKTHNEREMRYGRWSSLDCHAAARQKKPGLPTWLESRRTAAPRYIRGRTRARSPASAAGDLDPRSRSSPSTYSRALEATPVEVGRGVARQRARQPRTMSQTGFRARGDISSMDLHTPILGSRVVRIR